MPLCKDPSVSFLNKFGYNVVRLPRPDIEPLDILGKRDSLERLGRLSAVWKTSQAEPRPGPPQPLPSIEGQKTEKLELSIGLRLLGNALQGLGAAPASIDAAFKNARKIQFAFSNVTSSSVAPLEAGNYLASGDLDSNNPIIASYFLEDDGQAFLIVDVLKSDTLTVQSSDNSGASLKVDAPALQQVVGAKVGVTQEQSGESALKFKGEIPVTFGFKAFAIGFANGRWTLAGAKSSSDLSFDAFPADGIGGDEEPILFTTTGLVRL